MTTGTATLTTDMLAAWSSRLADVLASAGDTALPRKLGAALRELVPFKAVAPLVTTALLAHWDSLKEDLSSGYEDADAFHAHLNYVLENFGTSVLTNREKEVVHLTMRGYSDKLTARELNITPGTVRNHKKSIFSKLGVSSQGQVFGLFLKALQLPAPDDANADPVWVLRARH